MAAERLGGDTSSCFFGLGAQELTDVWRDVLNRAAGSDTTHEGAHQLERPVRAVD